MTATVHLKPGHVQPVWMGHPWIYAQAVARVDGGAIAGEEVEVRDPRGNFLGRGFYSPQSSIVVRILSRATASDEPFDAQFFYRRLERALQHRRALGLGVEVNSGYRLVHAEGDGLPGLIVDCLGDHLVLQFATLGMKRRDQEIAHALAQLLKPRAIVDRTPERIAKAERFLPRSSQDLTSNELVLRGTPGDAFRFTERAFRYTLARTTTQKTGFYFDQRDLRARVEGLASGKRVLDAYGYVGSFAMAAARGGATDVLSVDESALASEVGAACARDNGFADRVRFQRADARKVLAELSDPFDIVILDPPRLAPTRSAREAALMHYAKLATLGCRAVKPGGLLVFCSCSSAVDLFALTRALATGAQRANVSATVLERHFQAADHPVPAAFPEGLYLKALIARIEPR